MTSPTTFLSGLRILRVFSGSHIEVSGGTVRSDRRLSLTLRCTSDDCGVVLSTGQRLSEVDVNLNFVCGQATPQELDCEMTSSDIGFLSHTDAGPPFVYGMAILPESANLIPLFSSGTNGLVSFRLRSFPARGSLDDPFFWESGKRVPITSIFVDVWRDMSEQP